MINNHKVRMHPSAIKYAERMLAFSSAYLIDDKRTVSAFDYLSNVKTPSLRRELMSSLYI